jgi:hypothetical protein
VKKDNIMKRINDLIEIKVVLVQVTELKGEHHVLQKLIETKRNVVLVQRYHQDV